VRYCTHRRLRPPCLTAVQQHRCHCLSQRTAACSAGLTRAAACAAVPAAAVIRAPADTLFDGLGAEHERQQQLSPQKSIDHWIVLTHCFCCACCATLVVANAATAAAAAAGAPWLEAAGSGRSCLLPQLSQGWAHRCCRRSLHWWTVRACCCHQ
jgi:hypothetical protein